MTSSDLARARSIGPRASRPSSRYRSWSAPSRAMSLMVKYRCRYISRARGNRLDPGSRVLSRSKNAASIPGRSVVGAGSALFDAPVEPPAGGAGPVGHQTGQDREGDLLRRSGSEVDPDRRSDPVEVLGPKSPRSEVFEVGAHVPGASHHPDEPGRRPEEAGH